MIIRTFAKPQLLEFNGDAVSDHNRSELSVEFDRIETATRMANGTMRKYVVATKKEFGCSWEDLPHSSEFTIDGFWGGRDIYEFYADQTGPFWLTIVEGDGIITSYFVMISDFDYSIKKRGMYDLWDVSIRMVEV